MHGKNWTTRNPDGVRNVHTRVTPGPLSRAAELLDQVAEPGNSLWPSDRWPALKLDRGLTSGSRGGHGPVRYHVGRHEPGAEVVFVFEDALPYAGRHTLRVAADGEQVRWTHELVFDQINPAFAAMLLPLHDQLIEDLLDGAAAAMAGRELVRSTLPVAVVALRTGVAVLAREPSGADRERSGPAADLAATALLGVGALHALWATGSPWPARTHADLADTVLGQGAQVPGPAACLAVTGALTLAAALLQARRSPDGPLAVLPFGITDLGVKVVGSVLAVRGVGGLATSTFSDRSGPRFRRRDLLLYSPLCLALAAVHLATVRQS